MAFMGVRMSCDILNRKVDLARFALSAFSAAICNFAFSSCVSLAAFLAAASALRAFRSSFKIVSRNAATKMLLTSRTLTKLSLINSPRVTFRAALLYIAKEAVSILAGIALIVLFRMDSRMPFPLLTAKQDLAGLGSGTL